LQDFGGFFLNLLQTDNPPIPRAGELALEIEAPFTYFDRETEVRRYVGSSLPLEWHRFLANLETRDGVDRNCAGGFHFACARFTPKHFPVRRGPISRRLVVQVYIVRQTSAKTVFGYRDTIHHPLQLHLERPSHQRHVRVLFIFVFESGQVRGVDVALYSRRVQLVTKPACAVCLLLYLHGVARCQGQQLRLVANDRDDIIRPAAVVRFWVEIGAGQHPHFGRQVHSAGFQLDFRVRQERGQESSIFFQKFLFICVCSFCCGHVVPFAEHDRRGRVDVRVQSVKRL